MSDDNVHDPLWNDDDLLRLPAIQGGAHRIQLQNRCLDGIVFCVTSDSPVMTAVTAAAGFL